MGAPLVAETAPLSKLSDPARRALAAHLRRVTDTEAEVCLLLLRALLAADPDARTSKAVFGGEAAAYTRSLAARLADRRRMRRALTPLVAAALCPSPPPRIREALLELDGVWAGCFGWGH
jgi:hypothetical protein